MAQEIYPGSYYQPLFDFMHQWYGLSLIESDMMDIIEIVNKMQALHPSESAGVKGPVEMVQDLLDFMAECKGSNISPESRLISIENHLQKIVALAGSESPTAAGDGKEDAAAGSDEHPHQSLFDQYHDIKEKIGKLGYNTFIHSKEVEEYREWLRNDRYKHRIEWFEKEYPNGLYSKDNDGELFGINIMTKKFLAEADAAYELPAAAQSGKEEAVAFNDWVRDNTIADGAPRLLFKPTNERKTTSQLYDIFKSQNNQS